MATLGEVEEALGVLAHGYGGSNDAPGIAAFRAAWRDPAARAASRREGQPASLHDRISLPARGRKPRGHAGDAHRVRACRSATPTTPTASKYRWPRSRSAPPSSKSISRSTATPRARTMRPRSSPVISPAWCRPSATSRARSETASRRRRIPRSGISRSPERASWRRGRFNAGDVIGARRHHKQAARLGPSADRILVSDRHEGSAPYDEEDPL